MFKRVIIIGILLFLLCITAVACGDREPAGVPPTPTSLPAAAAAAIEPATPSPTATVAVTTTVMVTTTETITTTMAVTPTLPPSVVALQALNIRGGPGVDYPIVGYLAPGAHWTITGRSVNGQWWKIQCPTGTPSDECWITANETAVGSVSATAAPVAAAPPLPAATATPAPTPCVVRPAAGWTRQPVAAGDTLSSIASRTGGSVAQIMAANCLSSDQITAGSSLSLPGGSGAATAGSGQAILAGSQTGESILVPKDLAAVLSFSLPNSGGCIVPQILINNGALTVSNTLALSLIDGADNPFAEKHEWEAVQEVCIYVVGALQSQGEGVVVVLTRPDGRTQELPVSSYSQDGKAGLATFFLDTTSGDFEVSARLGNASDETQFSATLSSRQRIFVTPTDPARGEKVSVYLAGFSFGQPLILYGAHDNSDMPCVQIEEADSSSSDKFCYMKILTGFLPDPNGVQVQEIDTSWLAPGGFYRVSNGLTSRVDRVTGKTDFSIRAED